MRLFWVRTGCAVQKYHLAPDYHMILHCPLVTESHNTSSYLRQTSAMVGIFVNEQCFGMKQDIASTDLEELLT